VKPSALKPSAEAKGPLLAPELMARVRTIQVRTHKLVSSALAGAYRSNFRGTGIEFESVRPYEPGDDVRAIDWKVTARVGEPFIKTYVEDRTLILQLLVDTSRSMDFGSGEKSKREAAAEVCALLALVAGRNQDQVGLCLFADEPGLHLAPKKGQHHVLRLIREVMAAPATGRGSSLRAVLEHQLRHLKRRSLVMVVSDFLGVEASAWSDPLARLARRHDVIAVRVVDPLEEELPARGWVELSEIESGARLDLDARSPRVRAEWSGAAKNRRAALVAALRKANVDLVEVSTALDVSEPIARCFKRRAARQRR
jgi:uncharacterized protein (DUF58 family)